MQLLQKQAAKAGLKPQAFVLAMLEGYQLKERPSADLIDVLKNLQQINNNMNQIAVVANTKGFVDTSAYWENVRFLQQTVSKIMEVIY